MVVTRSQTDRVDSTGLPLRSRGPQSSATFIAKRRREIGPEDRSSSKRFKSSKSKFHQIQQAATSNASSSATVESTARNAFTTPPTSTTNSSDILSEINPPALSATRHNHSNEDKATKESEIEIQEVSISPVPALEQQGPSLSNQSDDLDVRSAIPFPEDSLRSQTKAAVSHPGTKDAGESISPLVETDTFAKIAAQDGRSTSISHPMIEDTAIFTSSGIKGVESAVQSNQPGLHVQPTATYHQYQPRPQSVGKQAQHSTINSQSSTQGRHRTRVISTIRSNAAEAFKVRKGLQNSNAAKGNVSSLVTPHSSQKSAKSPSSITRYRESMLGRHRRALSWAGRPPKFVNAT